MRYLVAFMLPLAASPLGVGAQAAGEDAAAPGVEGSEPTQSAEPTKSRLERWHSEAFVDPSDATQSKFEIKYEDRTEFDPYEKKVRNAKIGLGLSAGAVLVGVATFGAGFANTDILDPDASGGDGAIWTGVALIGAGGLSIIVTGALLGVRKRELRELQEAHYGTPRRVQWDFSRSRLVF